MTLGLSAFNCILSVNTGSLTVVAGVRDLDWSGLNNPSEDVTAHDDTWATKIGTVPDGGEITFDLNYAPANTVHKAIRDSLIAGTSLPWQLEFPDLTTESKVAFNALVTSFNVSGAVRGSLTASVTLAITGVVTPTDGS